MSFKTFDTTIFSIFFIVIFSPVVITLILMADLCIHMNFLHCLLPLLHLGLLTGFLWRCKKNNSGDFGSVAYIYFIPLGSFIISIPFILVSGLLHWLYSAGIYTPAVFHTFIKSVFVLFLIFLILPFVKDFFFRLRLIKICFSRLEDQNQEMTKIFLGEYYAEIPSEYSILRNQNPYYSTGCVIDDLSIHELSSDITKEWFFNKFPKPDKILGNKKENVKKGVLETELSCSIDENGKMYDSSIKIKGFYKNKNFSLGIKNDGLFFLNHEEPKVILNKYHNRIKTFVENYNIRPDGHKITDKNIFHLENGYISKDSISFKKIKVSSSFKKNDTEVLGNISVCSQKKNISLKEIIEIKSVQIYFTWKSWYFALLKKRNKRNHPTNIIYFRNKRKKIASVKGRELIIYLRYSDKNKSLFFRWFGYDPHNKRDIFITINHSSTENMDKKFMQWNKIIRSFNKIQG